MDLEILPLPKPARLDSLVGLFDFAYHNKQNTVIMPNHNRILLIIFLLTIFARLSFAQGPVSQITANQIENFVSVDGGFTIALPSKVTRFSPLEPSAEVYSGGGKFGWDLAQGAFVISFTKYISAPENPSKMLQTLGNNLIEKTIEEGGKFISRKEISFENNPGLEIKLQFKGGAIAFYRYYLVNNRLYNISSIWKEGDSGKTQIKILDSFKLVDRNTVLAKKIEDATPKALPQSPVVPKLKSDAEDDNLKGRVKTVIKEFEDLSGTWKTQGKQKNSIADYDESGNLVKQLFYNEALPYQVSVYGYIDGMRVINSGFIRYNDNQPIMAPGGRSSPLPTKVPDPRYSYSFEYKYADGKLAEWKWVKNNGAVWMTCLYTYKNNRVEELIYDERGDINQQYISTLDDQGNEIEKIDVGVLSYRKDQGDRKYIIKYNSFDERGNWTKSTRSQVVIENGKEIYKPLYIYYRTITYYP